MQRAFLNSDKDNTTTLLIYFCGWGTTPEAVKSLSLPEGWDFVGCYDYRSFPTTFNIPGHYIKIHLVAWSMGVWAAEKLAHLLPPLATATAINGTPYPMHDLYGIPTPIFQGTLNGLTNESRERFDRRMCGSKKLLDLYNTVRKRPTEELKEELLAAYNDTNISPSIKWNKAIISGKDMIVPHQNQLSYWQTLSPMTQILQLPQENHYPFLAFSSWSDLI